LGIPKSRSILLPSVQYIEVDGSEGEGGGQILRSAVAFSAIKGVPVKVTKVRAGRREPGLRRQHVSTLKVMAAVFGGELTGAGEGSSQVGFVPGAPRSGSLSLDMGTAASITLVLQTVVPAVALTGVKLSLELVGGTDVPWSPTFDYFDRVAREAYGAAGIRFRLEAARRGYYPRGGGMVRAVIEPCDSVQALDLERASASRRAGLLSRCSGLPRHVGERQLAAAVSALRRGGIAVEDESVSEEQSDSPGSSVLAYFADEETFLGSDAIGARGKPAEAVGEEAGMEFAEAAVSGARLDSHVADMLVPLLSLSVRSSKVRIPKVTPHLESGLRLARQFVPFDLSLDEQGGSSVVTVSPLGGG
jgi:RNA 3'-terminal phosphate cyclase (ATP)